MSKLEPAAWVVSIAALASLNLIEGWRSRELEAAVSVTPKELYRTLAQSQQHWQLIDVRPDPEGQYGDSHIPGSLPFPDCDPQKSPPAARNMVLSSEPAIIVSEDGDREVFLRCAKYFSRTRNLAGGMTAWVDANYPEDSGEYVPPSNRAGGGCL